MDWFEKIFGFKESKDNIEKYISIAQDKLVSSANNKTFTHGRLSTPTLLELRQSLPEENGKIKLSQILGDVGNMHREYKDALFQVASQFNLLEMVDPSYSPKDGITRYMYDRTQGPSCAMACAPGTLYRNYYSEVNTLDQVEGMFPEKYWIMKNGYLLSTEEDILEYNILIEKYREQIKENIKFGIQYNTEVIGAGHNVSQIYCSALPVSYNRIDRKYFEKFSRLVLEAAYEATFITAINNPKSNKVFLTLLGNGAFGNDKSWITESIVKNIKKYRKYDLDIVFINYSREYDKDIENLIRIESLFEVL